MNEQNLHNKEPEVIENYKEEGILTVETLDIASSDATSTSHKKHGGKKFTLTTPVAIIIASIIIALGLMGYGAIVQGGGSSTPSNMFKGRTIDSTDYIYGKENSKVIVVEYADPECYYCIQLSPTIKTIHEKYKDKVAFVYRHFPLTQIHPHAFDESRAIACVGNIGGVEKFYSYIGSLFDYKLKNKTIELKPTGKEDLAKSVGVDMNSFNECMKTKQTEKIVGDSINDGIAAGVQGTPSTFVLVKTRKGYEVVSMIDGARGEEFFSAAIEEALSR